VLQYYQDEDDHIHWRKSGNVPPGEGILTSPYDPDARLSKKRGSEWVGYKVHLTETCDEDTPHLITHVETTLATTSDNAVIVPIHEELQRKQCLPAQHLVDSGYGSSFDLLMCQRDYDVDLFGPTRKPVSWQANVEEAYDLSTFVIDFEVRTATCPQGYTTDRWYDRIDRRGKPITQVQFPKAVCQACPARERCTRSRSAGRLLGFMREDEFKALQAARQREQTDEFKEAYKKRAGVEGTISQAVGVLGMRHTRYRGLDKVHLQHLMTAAAMNLMRVIDWLSGKERATTRESAFARLAAA
jgi:transposase